ncbi:Hypothetical predicted protein [Paramuricea clavata]|uniref:Proline-rich transmembrane protein 3/4 domain-containing protein n=1 Tax=Paramuricea clavata TaxID=317549 RepID=A0A6S7HZU2_PARCT|nr:Hypothetical predicted protein [Paramuricea clavata]
MDKGWQLTYEVHYVSFGMAFLLLAGLCLRASIRARNTSFFAKSRVHYAVNTVFVIFSTSRALILLLHRYVNEEAIQSSLVERFLFNIGFPCLITAYTRTCYHCQEWLKDHARLVFCLVASQFYLFIAADILKTMVSYDERVILNIDHVLIFCSFLCGLCAIIVYAKIFCSDSSVDIIEGQDGGTEANVNDMNKTRSSNTVPIRVTFAILCIGISCVVIKLCIMAEILKVWHGDMDMESWDSLMYANILRMIELGNAAMMSYFIHCTTLRRKSLLQ